MAPVKNEIEFAGRFQRDYARAARHREFDLHDFEQLLDDLIDLPALPEHYHEHGLDKRAVNWAGFLECHLSGDLIVIYMRLENLVRLHRIGSHADLFRPARRRPIQRSQR